MCIDRKVLSFQDKFLFEKKKVIKKFIFIKNKNTRILLEFVAIYTRKFINSIELFSPLNIQFKKQSNV
jgi:hypothetical protein